IEDASALPFPDAGFEAAVSLEVFEHLFQPQRCAAEILRVLKPGGVLIVTVPNAAYWRRRVELGLFGRWNPLGADLSVRQPWRDPHIRFFTRGALQSMLTGAGFNPVTVSGHLGSLVRDIPWVRRFGSGEESARLYRALEARLPALLAYRLHAVAIKPGPARGL